LSTKPKDVERRALLLEKRSGVFW